MINPSDKLLKPYKSYNEIEKDFLKAGKFNCSKINKNTDAEILAPYLEILSKTLITLKNRNCVNEVINISKMFKDAGIPDLDFAEKYWQPKDKSLFLGLRQLSFATNPQTLSLMLDEKSLNATKYVLEVCSEQHYQIYNQLNSQQPVLSGKPKTRLFNNQYISQENEYEHYT